MVSCFRIVLDPYGLLGLLGFMVFLFYIIYSFLNNTGNGRRSLEEHLLGPTHTVMEAFVTFNQL